VVTKQNVSSVTSPYPKEDVEPQPTSNVIVKTIHSAGPAAYPPNYPQVTHPSEKTDISITSHFVNPGIAVPHPSEKTDVLITSPHLVNPGIAVPAAYEKEKNREEEQIEKETLVVMLEMTQNMKEMKKRIEVLENEVKFLRGKVTMLEKDKDLRLQSQTIDAKFQNPNVLHDLKKYQSQQPPKIPMMVQPHGTGTPAFVMSNAPNPSLRTTAAPPQYLYSLQQPQYYVTTPSNLYPAKPPAYPILGSLETPIKIHSLFLITSLYPLFF